MTHRGKETPTINGEDTVLGEMNIVLYSSELCPSCSIIKMALSEHIEEGIIRVIDIDTEPVDPNHNISDIKIIPTFFVNDKCCELVVSEHGITIISPTLGEINLVIFGPTTTG